VKIVVADSGPAISDDDAERIFDPFYAAAGPGQPVRGSGLSHSIVARIVDNLEGLVWVQRAREGGAAFHILLPLAGAAYPLDGPRATSIGWHA
jgi:signal transduction histidine kinase